MTKYFSCMPVLVTDLLLINLEQNNSVSAASKKLYR